MMKSTVSCLVGAAMVGVMQPVEGNHMLMQLIADDQDRLAREGFMQDDNKPPTVVGQPSQCIDGKAVVGEELFDCSNVDFSSFLSLEDLQIPELGHPRGFRSMDIWGWLSPTGKEITLINLDNGVGVVDTSDAENPCIIAKLPTGRYVDRWGDVKVYKDTLYHVKDKAGGDTPETLGYGIEVYDLLPFDTMGCSATYMTAPYIMPNYVFPGHGSSHNLAVNTESGRLYSMGTDFCEGGLIVLDISENRLLPTQIGCVDGDGYTHDAQCLTYDGPDPDYQGKEICLAFNEDTLTIWDLTVASEPYMISRTPYPNSAYSHQGWTNNDLTKVLLDDELDEYCNRDPYPTQCDNYPVNEPSGLTFTSTKVLDITDLDSPVYEGEYVHTDLAIDHNLYVWGLSHRKGWGGNPAMEFHPDPNFAYLNNYLAGVRILDIHSNDHSEWSEVGYFDVSPDRTEIAFAGSWSSYLHPSGVLAVSSIERGLFLLKPRMAYTEEFPQAPITPGGSDYTLIAFVLLVVALLLIIVAICVMTPSFVSTRRTAITAKETQGPIFEKSSL